MYLKRCKYLAEQEEERLRKIEEIILAHKGKKNTITAREIARAVGIPDNDTFITTRMLIRKLIKRKQLPIGALDNRGYFLMQDDDELKEYIKTLHRRIIGITDRKTRVIRYFENYHNKDFIETEEYDEDVEEDI